jgi:hypothetical protein
VSGDTPARAAASPIVHVARALDPGAAPGLTLTAGGISMMVLVSLLISILLQHPAMPQGMSHEEHMKKMQADAAMGFDQDKIAHHFRPSDEGGTIEVEARDARDTTTIGQIRAHLKEIAKAFAAGDFSKPLLTHGEQPPGVPVMQQLKDDIRYSYEERPRGGLVRVTSANVEARQAIQAFLEYQIREHHAK